MLKRGLSSVVATVLLIVLTLAAVSILAGVLIPFVKDGLEGSKSCVGVIGKIKFDEGSKYNCRFAGNATAPARTGFSVSILSDEIKGFRVGLSSSGSSDAYEINKSSSLSKIRMLNGLFSQPLEVPENGGTRTYVADGNFERITILPILSDGKSCDSQEEIVLDECIALDVIDSLGNDQNA